MPEYLAQNTVLGVDKLGTGVTWTPISYAESFDGPSNTVGSVEKTKLSSQTKEYRPGLPDPGELSFSLQYDPADTEAVYLRGLLSAPAIKSWRLTYPTLPKATFDTFDGFLTAFSPGGGKADEIITAKVTIKLTGLIVTTTAP
ncbi:phage tail tube protein [Paludisphaera borealis]|uniref:Phage tail protein n=1 Tax=Paludisphaera borealis TaxID=1387353 RepID=A0A1U7CNK6_9BACT|nr:phage tail tube protein [Paludisphaera borealis]APW60486.1 hypothetical protein BSF38_01956 [Paludisphaera borealis]